MHMPNTHEPYNFKTHVTMVTFTIDTVSNSCYGNHYTCQFFSIMIVLSC